MHNQLISNEITKLFAKEIFVFAEFWFDNYYKQDMNSEILVDHPDFIRIYRPQIVTTVANGHRAVSGGEYSQTAYYRLGLTEAQNGLTVTDAHRNRNSFEAATKAFLKKRISEGEMAISDREVVFYLDELSKFHDVIMPVIIQGYTDYAGKSNNKKDV
ncbi:hypothetical protein PWEIH_12855 [Listeria weihenstephanensis FSL R9-0317]|uniref:Uncharacterized protein n=1 Tax=Listeria weihenstephanensis TaxID=1006155 RepID=A0A1S7FU89_9LIST|nr:hypothetical protein [Listeria weihenstephanensis]AQY50962.1 hypothetical protein UE46_07850 [Listeria weihenstephanensis]EUJ36371.1 hypothetical protein PWEIH_12855 [Listeria weihenstephanensis FSL R9-0317]MBC1499904.1 hypothetical protein [Listeria weihenstephanensis]